MRVLVALGGNAMTGPDGSATAAAQQTAIARAMQHIVDVVAAGHEVVLTHGNGPQVGNLLLKNEIAAAAAPPVPLDWCGAQTQGTIGFTILNALEPALAARGLPNPVAAIVSRTLVDRNDPGFSSPTKPIGRFLPHEQALPLIAHGQHWQDRGDKGWRRVVASPEPLEVLETHTLRTLIDAGYLVVAVLAREVQAQVLVIATDVPNAIVGYGTPDARPVGRVSLVEMEKLAAEGHFASGSMGPKVEAALRFVRAGGTRSVITALDCIADALSGAVGTVIES